MPNFLELNPAYRRHALAINELEKKKIQFVPVNEEHIKLLKGCIDQFDKKYDQLRTLDNQILWSGGICLLCFMMASATSIFSTVALASFGYAAHRIGQREQKEKEYRQALENLINCTRWSLKKVPAGQVDAIYDCESALKLIQILPMVTEASQRVDLIDPSLNVSVRSKKASGIRRGHPSLSSFDEHMDQANLKLYGYRQGNVQDALLSVFEAFRNWLSAIFASAPRRHLKVMVGNRTVGDDEESLDFSDSDDELDEGYSTSPIV